MCPNFGIECITLCRICRENALSFALLPRKHFRFSRFRTSLPPLNYRGFSSEVGESGWIFHRFLPAPEFPRYPFFYPHFSTPLPPENISDLRYSYICFCEFHGGAASGSSQQHRDRSSGEAIRSRRHKKNPVRKSVRTGFSIGFPSSASIPPAESRPENYTRNCVVPMWAITRPITVTSSGRHSTGRQPGFAERSE